MHPHSWGCKTCARAPHMRAPVQPHMHAIPVHRTCTCAAHARRYALVDGPKHVPVWRFSRNQEVVPLHVKDANKFTDSVSE